MVRHPLAILAAAALLAGCGEQSATTPAESEPREAADARPELREGWKRVVNRGQGFNLGLPRSWSAVATGSGATLLRPPDRLVAITITADRTGEALRLPLSSYARRTMQALKGFSRIDLGDPQRVRAAYEAASLGASARKAGSGQRQRLLVVILRRKGLAAYPILVARNATVAPQVHEREITAILESFRGQPVEVGG